VGGRELRIGSFLQLKFCCRRSSVL
jgi:hypothetical protein